MCIRDSHCGEIGVRSILSGAETEWVLGQIPSLRVEMDPNWNHRYRTNMERLKSGNLLEVAKVVKGLKMCIRDRHSTGWQRKSG